MHRAWNLFNELLMLTSAGFVTAGWYQIRHRHVRRHRRFMLTGATLGAAFFVSYVAASFLIGDTYFGGPKAMAIPYQIFLQVHVLLATAAAVLGILTIRYALRAAFRRHKKVAPWTASAWLVAAGTGLVVFLLLFVVYPQGPSTTALWNLVLHSHPTH
ncbi:DUF420 domain-containing protein [Sulfobacillus harzensis]